MKKLLRFIFYSSLSALRGRPQPVEKDIQQIPLLDEDDCHKLDTVVSRGEGLVIFSKDHKQAQLLFPESKTGIILRKKRNALAWVNGNIKLELGTRYTLSIGNVMLYEGNYY